MVAEHRRGSNNPGDQPDQERVDEREIERHDEAENKHDSRGPDGFLPGRKGHFLQFASDLRQKLDDG